MGVNWGQFKKIHHSPKDWSAFFNLVKIKDSNGKDLDVDTVNFAWKCTGEKPQRDGPLYVVPCAGKRTIKQSKLELTLGATELLGNFDSAIDSSNNSLVITEIQNIRKSNMKKLKVLEGVIKNLNADVVTMENELGEPQKDDVPLLVEDHLSNVSDRMDDLNDRMNKFNKEIIESKLVDYVTLIKNKCGVKFDRLIQLIGQSMTQKFFQALTPFVKLYQKWTNPPIAFGQAEVLGNKLKQEFLDLCISVQVFQNTLGVSNQGRAQQNSS